MKPSYFFATAAIFFSTALLAQVPTAAQAPKVGSPGGKIAGIEGPSGTDTVDIKNGQALTTAAVGDTVYVGDHVLTPKNVSVSVTLADESELVLGPSSDFTIKASWSPASPNTHLQMLYGMLHAVVKKIYSDEQPFLVETPTSVMGVRGTEFTVEHDQAGGESTVHTLEGSVALAKSREDFRNPATHSVISAGTMSSMKRGMAVPPPSKAFERQAFFQHLSQRAPNFVKHVEARRIIRQQAPAQKQHPQSQLSHPGSAAPPRTATSPPPAAAAAGAPPRSTTPAPPAAAAAGALPRSATPAPPAAAAAGAPPRSATPPPAAASVAATRPAQPRPQVRLANRPNRPNRQDKTNKQNRPERPKKQEKKKDEKKKPARKRK
ncbi:MAG: FecR domain-containing protein [Deltaproteobacteria bacterium]|nr:FecR domain-containing protein [Deltaproteobacteria bacterium]